MSNACRAEAGTAVEAVASSKGFLAKSSHLKICLSGTETYSEWLLTKYRQLIVRWALVVAASCVMHVVHPEAGGIYSFTALMPPVLLFTVWASKRGRPKMVSGLCACKATDSIYARMCAYVSRWTGVSYAGPFKDAGEEMYVCLRASISLCASHFWLCLRNLHLPAQIYCLLNFWRSIGPLSIYFTLAVGLQGQHVFLHTFCMLTAHMDASSPKIYVA